MFFFYHHGWLQISHIQDILDDFVLELFCRSPLADAGETEDVVTVGQDAKASLRRGTLL